MQKTPLLKAVTDYAASRNIRFHMPGHKGKAPFRMPGVYSGVYPCDITELSAAGSLYSDDASGPFEQAEMLAAKAFGANATLLSASGATLCIQTLIFSFCSDPRPLLVDRHSHKSVFYAAAAYGKEICCIYPEFDDQTGLYKGITAAAVEERLKKQDVSGVFITSPDYYGTMSDIAKIAAVCKKKAVPLLVDNAHGSHLAFLKGGRLHPLKNGADASVDSAHKTLPALTGGAFLHICGPHFEKRHLKDIMSMLGSSSPSHLITASLDAARAYGESFPEDFDLLEKRCSDLRKALTAKGIPCLDEAGRDPLRIVADIGKSGFSARHAAKALEKEGIYSEMADERYLVLIPSPFNKDKDFQLFLSAICSIIKEERLKQGENTVWQPQIGERRITMQQAIRCKRSRIPAEKAAGYVAAEVVCIYPPAAAIVLPGEVITPAAAEYISRENPGSAIAVLDDVFPS